MTMNNAIKADRNTKEEIEYACFEGKILKNFDLRGLDLSYANLKGANFEAC